MRVRVNGIEIYYTVRGGMEPGSAAPGGAGNKKPLILLHGNGESHAVFDALCPLLEPYYTLYLPDSRGHGKTDRGDGPLSYEGMAADLAGFVRALGLAGAAVCGFSDGGIVALLCAIACPELLGPLVLCGANTQPQHMLPECFAEVAAAYAETGDEKLALMLFGPHIGKEQLAKIANPVLVVAGSDDIFYEADTRALAAALPHSRLQLLPGQTHDSYVVERPSVLYGCMLPFLERFA